MKRITLSILMILAVVLTACGSAVTSTSTSSTQSSNSSPTELQLAVGILKLESTSNRVTAAQAPELLMLWQVYAGLSQSDTAAQEEVNAVIEQVQETLTADQLQVITDMQISQQDVTAIMQGSTVTTSSLSSSTNVTVPSGSMPAGGPPEGGGAPLTGGMPGDFGGVGSTTSMTQAKNVQAGSAGVPSALVEAVIQVLRQKISS